MKFACVQDFEQGYDRTGSLAGTPMPVQAGHAEDAASEFVEQNYPMLRVPPKGEPLYVLVLSRAGHAIVFPVTVIHGPEGKVRGITKPWVSIFDADDKLLELCKEALR